MKHHVEFYSDPGTSACINVTCIEWKNSSGIP